MDSIIGGSTAVENKQWGLPTQWQFKYVKEHCYRSCFERIINSLLTIPSKFTARIPERMFFSRLPHGGLKVPCNMYGFPLKNTCFFVIVQSDVCNSVTAKLNSPLAFTLYISLFHQYHTTYEQTKVKIIISEQRNEWTRSWYIENGHYQAMSCWYHLLFHNYY